MAERRMFAKTIMDSDAFLDMPLSTQALYFHLSMRADDDGFVNNAKKIQRMLGCTDDDLKILLSKNFIIPFENGVCVIKHWLIHNYIQKDRYKPTVYGDLKDKLTIKENKVYSLDTQCIQNVSIVDTQVRLGKVRIEKDITPDGFDLFWDSYGKKKGKSNAIKEWNKIKPNSELVALIAKKAKEQANAITDTNYRKDPERWLKGKHWEDEIAVKPYNDIF